MSAPASFAEFIAVIAAPGDAVTLQRRSSALAPNRRWRLSVCSEDGSIRTWDAKSFAELMREATKEQAT